MPQVWGLSFGDIVAVITVLVAISGYILSHRSVSKADRSERDTALKTQVEMHVENRNRLDSLARFQTTQVDLNVKRDEQITQLTTQTSTLAEMAKGFNRRLEMVEDRSN